MMISSGSMMHSDSGFVPYRGGTTPEGGSIFSEGDVMHLKGGVFNTERGMAHSAGHIMLFGVASRFLD